MHARRQPRGHRMDGHECRRQAWTTLRESAGDEVKALYDAITESLGPAEAITDQVPTILELYKQQGAALATRSYRIARTVAAQCPGELGRARAVLGAATSEDAQAALIERLEKPVGGEDFRFRAALI